MAACSDLTDIKNTGIVQPESENNAVGAAAFYAGATQKFVAATQNSIMFTGLFTDEWIDGTNGGVFGYLDARRAQTSVVQTGQELTDYSNALIAVRFGTEALLKYAPKPGSRVAQMYSYSGYLELFLAEQFCNGIPFGNIDFNGTVTHGAGITTAETYARAIAHFDSAIAVSDSARVTNLALLGKGRALVGLGKFAEAAAAVAAVPTNFVYNLDINAAVAGNQNTLYTFGTLNKRPASRREPTESTGSTGSPPPIRVFACRRMERPSTGFRMCLPTFRSTGLGRPCLSRLVLPPVSFRPKQRCRQTTTTRRRRARAGWAF